jgi:glycerol-3-phosphate dehydrogenase
VVSAIAGLRPLVGYGNKLNTQKLIRDHEVETNPDSGLISILGGKWTTYRAMAEDTVNAVQRQLGLPVSRCLTQSYRLSGALVDDPALWQSLISKFDISPETARHLTEKFGSDVCRVLDLARHDSSLAAPIVAGAPGIQAEIVYSIRDEMAMSIEDVLARRIGLQSFAWESAIAAAPVVGAHFAREYGWTAAQTQQAVREYQRKLACMIAQVRPKPEHSLVV